MPEEPRKKIWFPAKRYGSGWGLPNCRQGWLVVAVWLVVLTAGSLLILTRTARPALALPFPYVMIVVLAIIVWRKGEPPRRRWGEKDASKKTDDNR